MIMSKGSSHLSLARTTYIQSTAYHPTSSSPILLVITHTYKHSYPNWTLSFCFCQQNPVHISLILHICHKPCPAQPPWFHHTHTYNILQAVEITSLCIMRFPPSSCHFLPQKPEYLPQHPIHKHYQHIFLPHCVRLQVSNNDIKQQGLLQFCKNLTFRFLHSKQENKRWPEWSQALCEFNVLLISSCTLCVLCLVMLHVIKSITLYAFFWVIPWLLNFMCRHFGTLCLVHLHRRIPIRLWRWTRQSVLKCWDIKFRGRRITQKKAYSIKNMAKVWNKKYFTSMGRKLQETFDHLKKYLSAYEDGLGRVFRNVGT